VPRAARIVVPDCAHHVIQRGNRQQLVFFSDNDRRRYLALLAKNCADHSVRCLAWCLMSNHIHLVLVPPSADALRAILSRTHTSYAQRINLREGLSGHLFQGRYASYPMGAAHLAIAVRYIENNPVKAGLVGSAEHWPWSSARAHISGAPDGLTDLEHAFPVTNWRAYLADGVEANERDDELEAAMRSGRPLGRVAVPGNPVTEPRPRGRPRLNK
jgi:putative transposase